MQTRAKCGGDYYTSVEVYGCFADVRCKNKFWGKSMEIVPIGTTHVTLPGYSSLFL